MAVIVTTITHGGRAAARRSPGRRGRRPERRLALFQWKQPRPGLWQRNGPHLSNYGGLLAAPGDVDGDGWADILLADLAGAATLIGQPEGGTPTEFATIEGVGGAANAPYASRR